MKWVPCFFLRWRRGANLSSLAWAELRLCFAHIFRKFDMKPDDSRYVVSRAVEWPRLMDRGPSPEELLMRETFLPFYYGPHVRARVIPVVA
jgi:hypothetical protein